jgi:hypothetical protein
LQRSKGQMLHEAPDELKELTQNQAQVKKTNLAFIRFPAQLQRHLFGSQDVNLRTLLQSLYQSAVIFVSNHQHVHIRVYIYHRWIWNNAEQLLVWLVIWYSIN